MNKSKNIILERLKSKIHDSSHREHIPLMARHGWTQSEMVQMLSEKLRLSKAEVFSMPNKELINWLNEELPKRKIKNILSGEQIANEIAQSLTSKTELMRYDNSYESFSESLFNEIDASITKSVGAIAYSGSVVLQPTTDEPRLMSLVPNTHIVLVDEESIYETFGQIMLDQNWSINMPSNTLLISGPSKTADIEQVLAYGVHGPKELIVLILTS
jgi:L-lactate dehydrogenase complex protein LldG